MREGEPDEGPEVAGDPDDAAEAAREVDLGETEGWERAPGRAAGEGTDAEPVPDTSWRRRDPLPTVLVLLTGITGAADAVSFLALGQVFTANMTGNIALLGFGVAGAPDLGVEGHLLSLGAFLVGALLGGRVLTLLDQLPRHHWMLLTSAANASLILAAAVLATGLPVDSRGIFREEAPVIAALAVAMGVRNAVVHRLHVADLPVSVVTSTLTGLVSDSALAGHENVRPVRRAAAVASMFLGALLGAVLVLHVGAAWTLFAVALLPPLLAVGYTLHPMGSTEPMRPLA